MTDVASPCIDICDLDRTGQWCIGCGRSLDEIAGWASASDDERRAITGQLAARVLQLKA